MNPERSRRYYDAQIEYQCCVSIYFELVKNFTNVLVQFFLFMQIEKEFQGETPLLICHRGANATTLDVMHFPNHQWYGKRMDI